MSDLDNQPINYWRGQGVYLTMYLTLAMAAGILVTLFLRAAGGPGVVSFLIFQPWLFMHGALWQPFTYVFVNPPSFFTPLGLICLYFWGVEVEKYLGRRFLVGLLATLILGPAVVILALYPILHLGGALAGDQVLLPGLLIAFATLYPDLDYLGGWVPLKWFAFACVLCGSLLYFADRDWLGVGGLWLNCFVAFYMVRNARGLFDWKLPRWFHRRPKFRVVPREAAQSRSPLPAVTAVEGEMDALLDKIARTGLSSLTTAERERLEKVREQMLRKGP